MKGGFKMYSLAGSEYIKQIVEEHSLSMFRASYALCGNKADAEDAVQEAFLRLIEKDPTFKDDEHEKAWLLRVTINITKNMLKSSHRTNLQVNEDILYEKNQINEVIACVLTLDERYRSVIHLYYYEGYSIKEIASILKLPPATVGTRLSRARKLLRNILEGDVEF